MSYPYLAACCALALFAVSPTPATAHDSWLSPPGTVEQADGEPQALHLSLPTGDRYPLGEFAVAPASVVQSACRSLRNPSVPLRAQRVLPRSLVLQARQGPGDDAALRSCWLALKAHDIEIEPPLVQVYLNEIRAPRRPQGLGLEIVPLGSVPLAVGQPLLFQVLRDGKPLPDLSVELVSERNPLGNL